ncbi:hypothetical protein BC937DRAFT_91409, partial [Endogone sp. FLAS-F59071]
MFKPTKVVGSFPSVRGIRAPEGAQHHVGSFGRGRGRTGRNNPRLSSTRSIIEPNVGRLTTRQAEEPTNLDQKFEDVKIRDEIDERLGFRRYHEGSEKLGWLINMHSTLVKDPDWPGGRAAVDYYFLEEDGRTFKCTLLYQPYFFIGCKVDCFFCLHAGFILCSQYVEFGDKSFPTKAYLYTYTKKKKKKR